MSARFLKQSFVGSVGLALLVSACGLDSGRQEPLVTAKGAALHQAADCDDLLLQIQADALSKLDEQVALYKKSGSSGYYPRGGVTGGDGDLAVDAPSGNGTNSGGETSGGSDAPTDPSSHSTTNTQVAGVDEADIVKLSDDGKRMYVVHGQQLKVLATWPAADAKELATVTVAGNPYEMFEAAGLVTVFSTVMPTDLPTTQADSKLVEPGYYCYYGGTPYTQVSVYDVRGDSPSLTRELLFEGSYVSSRRHDDVVRAVLQGGFRGQDIFYPDIDYYDSFGRPKSDARIAADLDDWRDDVALDIRNTTLADWLPASFERVEGSWQALADQCDSYYIPEPGLVASGVTQVVTFEPAQNQAPQLTSVLGGTNLVYANLDTLVVSQEDYRWYAYGSGTGPRSALHEFSLMDASSRYTASGFVAGVPINQFALDKQGEVLRIVTTEDDWSGDPKNRLFTLAPSDGQLSVLDSSERLGEPGERVYSVRFLGDRAYVVTFRQTDPLYAIDVSDPLHIEILGELHIPGFSEYIHPLGTNKLLTIGQDADANGVQTGLALQIFDVADPTMPQQLFKHAFDGYSYSEASYNHKAFTYVDDYFDGKDDLLLFPLVTYEPDYQSSLRVFRVSEADGLSELGTIDHSSLINRGCDSYSLYGQPCYYYYGNEMRRGMQIDDYVYALSQGGVTVHELAQLTDGPLATVEFELPSYDSAYYGDYCYADGGVGVSEPAPADGPTMAVGGSAGL